MPITEIKQPEEEPEEELLLTDEVNEADNDAPEADDTKEPIEEPEYDTLDDEPREPETPLIKQLREQLKQSNREKAELRRQAAPAAIQRTKKPDLWEDCEGDPDRFEAAYEAWRANEQRADEQERNRDTERQQAAQTWQQELQSYKTKAIQLGKADFDEAESAVVSTLTDAQQSTIVMAAKDPARFVYALGRSPQRLMALAQITNPIKLAAEVARIEGSRMMARKEPANIDVPIKGNARLSVETEDKKEAALIKEAQATGNIDKLRAYRREQRSKAA